MNSDRENGVNLTIEVLAQRQSPGRKLLPPSSIAEPPSVHLSHVAHANDSNHEAIKAVMECLGRHCSEIFERNERIGIYHMPFLLCVAENLDSRRMRKKRKLSSEFVREKKWRMSLQFSANS
jgi:hypothetical protein